MGGGRWTVDDWKTYSTTKIDPAMSVDDIYTSRGLDKDLNPKGVTLRESCDSADNPESTAIIIGLDVTGSMDRVLDKIARTGLKTIAEEVYNRKPVTNPQIMFMGIGDANYDSAPLQITQFESDIRIAEWLSKIYLERGGGGNDSESYILPWYFAAMHTKIDCFEKRGKKGVLFTMGDECPTPFLTSRQIEEFLGEKPQFDTISAEELLTMVSRQYEVFHLIIEEGSYASGHIDKVTREWTALLGQHAIRVSDHTKLGEIITSTLQVLAGEDVEDVVGSWDGKTAIVVRKAVSGLSKTVDGTDGLVKF